MERQGNHSQENQSNIATAMERLQASTDKLQSILAHPQAQTEVQAKWVKSGEQVLTRLQAKFSVGQIATFSPLPQLENFNSFAMQEEVMKALEASWNTPHRAEIDSLVSQTVSDSWKNPHWNYAVEEVSKGFPAPYIPKPASEIPQIEEMDTPEEYFESLNLAERRQQLKENIIIDGIASHLRKDRIKNKLELNIDYNKSYPATKNSPSIYNENNTEIKNILEEWDTEIINGLVDIAAACFSENSRVNNAIRAFSAFIKRRKNNLYEIEKNNTDIDEERAVDLYQQNYLNLKGDITRNLSQSMSGSTYKESYINACLINPSDDSYKICPIIPDNNQ